MVANGVLIFEMVWQQMDDERPGNGEPNGWQQPNGSVGQEPRDLERFFPLVNSIARRTLRGELPAFDYGDAVATGLLALVKSEKRVSVDERGFISYASLRVRGAILDAIHELRSGPPSTVSLGSTDGRHGNARGSFDVADGSCYSSPEWLLTGARRSGNCAKPSRCFGPGTTGHHPSLLEGGDRARRGEQAAHIAGSRVAVGEAGPAKATGPVGRSERLRRLGGGLAPRPITSARPLPDGHPRPGIRLGHREELIRQVARTAQADGQVLGSLVVRQVSDGGGPRVRPDACTSMPGSVLVASPSITRRLRDARPPSWRRSRASAETAAASCAWSLRRNPGGRPVPSLRGGPPRCRPAS